MKEKKAEAEPKPKLKGKSEGPRPIEKRRVGVDEAKPKKESKNDS